MIALFVESNKKNKSKQNRDRGLDTWNSMTAVRGGGRGGAG